MILDDIRNYDGKRIILKTSGIVTIRLDIEKSGRIILRKIRDAKSSIFAVFIKPPYIVEKILRWDDNDTMVWSSGLALCQGKLNIQSNGILVHHIGRVK